MTMKQRNQRGFTLIEIMVVMVILGLLVAVVAPNIMGRSDQAKITIAKTQMSNIANALDLYRLDNGHYPSTQQGLEALVNRPTGSPEPNNWNPDGYLKSVPEDPWNNDYQYMALSSSDYELYSYGADGTEGGEGDAADISVHDIEQ